MSLSLVHSFDAEKYSQYHVAYFTDPLNPNEAYRLRDQYQGAINRLGIADYKLFFEHSYIEARFTSLTDSFRFSVAIKPSEKVEVDYFHADMNSSNRSLDRVRKSLAKLVRAMGLKDDITFELDRENKSVAVFAKDGNSFIAFDNACQSLPKIKALTHG